MCDTVVADPTGSIPTTGGRITRWTINAYTVGVPISAAGSGKRVDLSHLGKVVSVIAIDHAGDGDDAVATMYDWWAATNADSDRVAIRTPADSDAYDVLHPGARNRPAQIRNTRYTGRTAD